MPRESGASSNPCRGNRGYGGAFHAVRRLLDRPLARTMTTELGGRVGTIESKGSGAARGIRTPDPIITNDVLYRLSYCGISSAWLRERRRRGYSGGAKCRQAGRSGIGRQTHLFLSSWRRIFWRPRAAALLAFGMVIFREMVFAVVVAVSAVTAAEFMMRVWDSFGPP